MKFASFLKNARRGRSLSAVLGTVALGCALFFAAPAQAQLSDGTGVQNIEIGLNFVELSTDKYGGISGPGSLTSGITIPTQLGPDSTVFSFMPNPNAIYQSATDLNKELANLFPKENVVDIVVYNKVVDAYNKLRTNLTEALDAADALPTNTPEEALRKQNALDTIDVLITGLEKIAPRLQSLRTDITAMI